MGNAVDEAKADFKRRLRDVRNDLKSALNDVDALQEEEQKLILVLTSLNQAAVPKKSPRLSPKGRAAISKAAKKRWAKYRKGTR